MSKTIVTLIVSPALAALFPATAANAKVYNFTLTSSVSELTPASPGKLTIAAAPELPTWAMLGLGVAGLGLRGRRRADRLADRCLA
jgi:hypothetical protein